MIRFVKGILREVADGLVVVEAGGIGYGIRVPQSVLSYLPPVGEELKVYTYFSVREDAMELFGFLRPEDRAMFVQLLSVNGIGPKGALGILSALEPDALRIAIVTGDARAISRAPGIGLKTAQRVILDLKDKIDSQDILGMPGGAGSGSVPGQPAGLPAAHGAAREAEEALVALGYSSVEASRAVRKVSVTPEMTADEVLKQSLKHLAYI